VLLYELLTGHTPLSTKSSMSADAIRRIIREEEPQRPSARVAADVRRRTSKDATGLGDTREPASSRRRLHIDSDLDWIVLKCLEKDRARRYESASELVEDLRRYLHHEPVRAAAPTFGYAARKFARRHRGSLILAGLIAILLITGTALASWFAWNGARAAAQARTEAATAEAVTRFLNEDLFGMADPDNQPDQEITVRALLDRASQQLSKGSTEQPLVDAAIHTTMGRAYLNLSRHGPAQTHLLRALNLYERELGEAHEKTIAALLDVAAALERSGNTTPAVSVAERARDLALSHFASDHPLVARCLTRLAYNYYRLRRREEAYSTAARAWGAAQRVSNSPEIEYYHAMFLVAKKHTRAGNRAHTEELLRESVRKHIEQLGHHHRKTARAKNGLATHLYDHGIDYAEAETLFREARQTYASILGDDHDSTRWIRRNLALLYEKTGRPTEALRELRQILDQAPKFREARNDLSRVLSRLRQP
jgi:eukaryotic-like serine/threonine-protein kinase